ncbi:hypothetical protein BD410DRAFT_806175 [Rickenella mellea]|uniref:Uncharacterized protein n=1 Tax=Rickenella mellea TaxID=50990 RepID=A0A4Y7PU25_9AGAM|nr:hypothetical protein BD410DRAFT_806175 [Rickenella mellea]
MCLVHASGGWEGVRISRTESGSGDDGYRTGVAPSREIWLPEELARPTGWEMTCRSAFYVTSRLRNLMGKLEMPEDANCTWGYQNSSPPPASGVNKIFDTTTHQPTNTSLCEPESMPEISQRQGTAAPPQHKRLTKVMRAKGHSQLVELRIDLDLAADEVANSFVPLESYFPDDVIKIILDNFVLIDRESLPQYISSVPYLENYHDAVWAVMLKLDDAFKAMRKESRRLATERKAARIVAAAEAAGNRELTESSADSEAEDTDSDEDVGRGNAGAENPGQTQFEWFQ